MKPQLRQNPETGKWELYSKELEEADCYIGLTHNRAFVVESSSHLCEIFLKENGGGNIFAITHYQHNDEVLPQSNFYKEVVIGG